MAASLSANRGVDAAPGNSMIRPLPCLLACLLPTLVACQRAPEPVTPASDRAAAQAEAIDGDADAATDQPGDDVPPATAPPGTLPPRLQQGDQALARWDGYGDVRLGMSADEVRAHWGGRLAGGPDESPGGGADGCYYLRPVWAVDERSFGFMIESGKLARYESHNAKELAPGGGRVGMSAAQIQRLYPDHLEVQPHKYEDGARYLRITQPGQAGVLLFETDPQGIVTRWRVGLPPAVDYVEGCS